MRTKMVMSTFLALGLATSSASALDNVGLKGSDTLEDLTKQILAACPEASGAGITYLGGGSSSGEAELLRTSPATGGPTQTVAPMSRFLARANTCNYAGGATTAEGLAVALDGLAITADADSTNACGGVAFSNPGTGVVRAFTVGDANGVEGIQCPGCDGDSYRIGANDWRDALRLVYAGVHHDAAATKDCNSDARHALVNNWGNLFEATCAGGGCTELKHAFRRADLSGTTDTFLALLGLPAVDRNPFCNGGGLTLGMGNNPRQADFLDLDPIRRPCDGNGEAPGPDEQVCGRDGRLGLVVPVFVPENLTRTEAYPTAACTPGVFRFMAGPLFPNRCPNGTTPILGKCFAPVQRNADGSVNGACVNRANNCPIFTPAGTDCRSYNQFVRRANDPAGTILRDANGRQLIGSFYRVHTTAALAGGNTCQEMSATVQIGCLSQASPCSIGFAGREAAEQPGVAGLTVRGIEPTITRIQNLVTTPADPNDDYPLSRKLYINTMAGFESVTGGELALARCFADTTKLNPAVTAVGFVAIPGGPICEDFAETQCGAAANVNACAGNPAGIPSAP